MNDGPEWFVLVVPAYSGCPGKKAVKRLLCVVVVCKQEWLNQYTDTVTDRINAAGNEIASVSPSVCFHFIFGTK